MTRILITGAGGSAAYNFYDALKLARTDLYVVGVDARPQHLELIDVDKRYIVPPVSDPTYIDTLNKIIEIEKIEFVHPQPDVEVNFLSQHKDKINAKLFLPDHDVIEACHDKMQFNTILAKQNVAVPNAIHIKTHDDLKRALKELTTTQPKIWLRAIRGAGSRASLPINSFYQGDAWIDYWHSFRGIGYGDFMASEFLPGHEFAWQSVWYNGELVTAQARERVEYIFGNLTPSGQTSSPSVAKTVNRDDINETGQAAVKAVCDNPHGVFCVDMKEGSDGEPRVTEINAGRFFTTSNFFAHAGLNMPQMYVELGLQGKLNTPKPPKLNPLKEDLYWVRMIDMGFKLVDGDSWTSSKI